MEEQLGKVALVVLVVFFLLMLAGGMGACDYSNGSILGQLWAQSCESAVTP